MSEEGELPKRIRELFKDENLLDSTAQEIDETDIITIINEANKKFPKQFRNYWKNGKLITWADKVQEWRLKQFGNP